jgi:hypothetical protein
LAAVEQVARRSAVGGVEAADGLVVADERADLVGLRRVVAR